MECRGQVRLREKAGKIIRVLRVPRKQHHLCFLFISTSLKVLEKNQYV